MTPDFEHWERLQALFHLAEESPDADLDQLLATACDDPELRQRARALIETGRRTAAAPGLPGAPALPGKAAMRPAALRAATTRLRLPFR